MKRNKCTKDDAEILHFQKRCVERLGYVLTQKGLKDMMKNKEMPFLGRQSNRITMWKLTRRGTYPYVLVYDSLRHHFVTILTWDMFKNLKTPCVK